MITKQHIRNNKKKSTAVELTSAELATKRNKKELTHDERDELLTDEYAINFFNSHREATTFTASAPGDGIYVYTLKK